MPSLPGRSGRPTSAEHQAAVSRRLDLLRAELSGPPVRSDAPVEDEQPWWSEATRVPGPRLQVVPPEDSPSPSPSPTSSPSSSSPEHIVGPPPWVPVPGRHASRRARDVTAWVPETLRGRVALGSAQVTVVAVLVAIGLAVTAWTVVRARPEPVAAVADGSATAGSSAGSASTGVPGSPVLAGTAVSGVPEQQLVQVPLPSAAVATPRAVGAQASEMVTVDVAGKVRRPGIAVLDPGARVVDALKAAGGARSGVDLASLNLARVLVDGEQILVGVPSPPGAAASALASAPPGVTAAAGTGVLVNLNSGTEADLDTLPEVGPVTAQSIISWREEHGGFTSVDELLEVDGIGEATLSRLAPLVTV
ncbi:MAG: helix-hairpin-helix domain-containing protein [Nocardioides sp.]|nr:helix-hairpin-helix domain-containing protein [Nocardioides sp.]